MSLDQDAARRFVMALCAVVETRAEKEALYNSGGAQEDSDALMRKILYLTDRAADELRAAIKAK